MIRTYIRTFVSFTLLFFILVIFGIPVLLLLLLPARWRYDNRVYFFVTDILFKAVLKSSLIPITYEGVENIPDEPSIIVANHQSSLDIPLIGKLFNGCPHLWLAAKYLSRTWIGPVIRRMTVQVDTSSSINGGRSVIQALRLLKGKKRHVVIFPEGARYTDAQVHAFFSGFAIIAKRTGRPVVPVMINGAYKVYPPDSWLIYRHPIKVIVGKPFSIEEGETERAFTKRVREWFLERVEE